MNVDTTLLTLEQSLHISFFHFVCDANVRTNVGGYVDQTLEWITKIVNEDDVKENDIEKSFLKPILLNLNVLNSKIHDLIQRCQFKTFDTDQIYSKRRELKTTNQKIQDAKRKKDQKIAKMTSKEQSAYFKRMMSADYKYGESDSDTNEKRYEDVKSGKEFKQSDLFQSGSEKIFISQADDIKDFEYNIVVEMAKHLKQINDIYKSIDENNDLCYEGGTFNHAIAYYISGNIVTICNSGDGIDNHRSHQLENGEQLYEVIAKFEIKPNMKWILLAIIIMCNKFNQCITKANRLYHLLFKVIDNSSQDMKYFFHSQIAGSCSFWSVFYLLMYKMQWDKEKLEKCLLKYAESYFIKNIPRIRDLYGFNGLLSCVTTKFERHGLQKNIASIAKIEYESLLQKKQFHIEKNFTKKKNTQKICVYEKLESKEEEFGDDTNYNEKSLFKLFTSTPSEQNSPVDLILFYQAMLEFIYQDFENKKNDFYCVWRKMHLWMEIFYALYQNYYNLDKLYPNFAIHLNN